MPGASSAGLRLEVLGPLRVEVDGVTVEITRSQVRRLAVILGAHAGEFVSNDALIESLWPDRLPADPRAALLVATSRLRAALGVGGSGIESGELGVRAVADTDLADFDRLRADNGTPEREVGRLEQRLRLWRGRAFGEVADCGLLQPAARRLNDAWLNDSIRLAELLFESGEFDRCVGIAQPLHSEQLEHERTAVVLARALARLGRRTEALGVLTATREQLRDEFGLDVGSHFRAIEHEVLTSDVDIVPPHVPASPPGDGDFVGRAEELDWLSTPSAGWRVIVAEPGAGKSALLARAATRYREAGVSVWSVQATATPDRPVAVVADLVTQLAAHHQPRPDDELVRSAVARLTGRPEPDTPAFHAVTRDALVQAAARFVADVAPASRAVVLVDDAHWLDATSAEILQLAAATCDVILATRPEGATVGASLDGAVVDTRSLRPLSRDDIGRLVAGRLRPADVEPHTDEVWHRSGGNALFATLLLDHIVEGGRSTAHDLPVSLLVAIQQRLMTLSAGARDTLTVAAVFGGPVSPSVIRQLRPSFDRDLQEAVDAHLVQIRPDGSIEFIHQLLAEGASALVGDGRRVELHDAIGRALEADGRPARELVHHFESASALDPERAARAHLGACVDAERTFDWNAVTEHASAGLLLTGDGCTAARLAILLGRAQRALHLEGSATALLQGAEAARDAGDDVLFAEVVIVLVALSWSLTDHGPGEVLALYEAALELELPVATRARLCAASATLVVTGGDVRARSLYHEAVDLALDLEDPTAQADILRYARWGLGDPDDFALFSEVTTLLIDLVGDASDFRWACASNQFIVGAISGDRAQVDEAVERLRVPPAAGRTAQHEWEIAHLEAIYAQFDGDQDTAEQWMARLPQLVANEGSGDGAGGVSNAMAQSFSPIYGVLLLSIRASQGRLGEMLPLVDAAIANDPNSVAWHGVAAQIAASTDDRARASTALARVRELGLAALTRDFTWSATMKMIADATVAVGDIELARELRVQLEPYSGRLSWAGVCGNGPIDEALAAIAELCGDLDAAAEFRARADDLLKRLERTPSSPTVAAPV